MTVYLVWMNDMVLGVRPTYRKALNLANRTMKRQDLAGQCWTGRTQQSAGRARFHSTLIPRLEIEPWRVR
jgi:hypothetical protein